VHLRPPSVDHGVQAFLWAVVFFLFLWLGMLAVGVSQGTSFVLALVLGLLIFLFVRIFGEKELGPPQSRARRRRIP
jgi:glycerol uptake facilitator-like aquaporin